MSVNDFLAQHAVFTIDDLDRFLAKRGTTNPNTRKTLLNYHRKRGRIVRIRRGLYANVQPGSDPSLSGIDPYLVAAKVTEDAVLAYHTALEFHGKAYSVFTSLYCASKYKSLPVQLRAYEIKCVPMPPPLLAKDKTMYGVDTFHRSGVDVRVSTLERTLVDVLDRPDLSGSWEEIWRSLEMIEFFDLDQVIEYTFLLENRTTAAKVGFFLEQHKESLLLDDAALEPLRKLRPKQPHYLERAKRKDCQWIKGWNLMVPAEVQTALWGEVL
jgi:predicted transcriptional regulator of viral defense system